MANYNLREVLKQLGRNILSWVKTNCVNNCTSTATNLPLAAAQGKALQTQITTLNSNIKAIGTYEKILDRASNDSAGSNVAVSDISGYREIMITLWNKSNSRMVSETRIPYHMFTKQVLDLPYPYDTSEFSYIAYGKDTTIYIRNAGTKHTTSIYGIK